MNRRALVWVLAVALLAASPLDDWLDRAEPRLLLLEIPGWLALGYVAGRRFRGKSWVVTVNPLGLTGLAFFVGSLGFWMIPRSVDRIGTSELADQLMHANLLAAGLALSASRSLMPFVVRSAGAIYATSMIFALGMVYAHYSALLCGTFDLAQQRETGHWLLLAFPVVVALTVISGARALARESPRGGARDGASDPMRRRASTPVG